MTEKTGYIKETGYMASAKCTRCGEELKSGIAHAGKITGRDVQDWAHLHAANNRHPVRIEVSYTVNFIEREDLRICRVCRTCGCTDNNACIALPENIDPPEYGATTCYWVEQDLCSACARKEDKEVITA